VLGPTFTRGRPRNHDQPGDTPCNHVDVHPIADTRARVPEPVFPAGPAAPTACTVPGAMVSHGRPPVLGWHLPRPLGPGSALSPFRFAAVTPGAQPALPVQYSPQSRSTVLQDERCRTAMDDWYPRFQRPSLVPPAAQGSPRLSRKVAKGEGCGTCHRAPRPQKTSPSVVILGTGSRYSPGPAALPPGTECAPAEEREPTAVIEPSRVRALATQLQERRVRCGCLQLLRQVGPLRAGWPLERHPYAGPIGEVPGER
jgi:hypothetical protein